MYTCRYPEGPEESIRLHRAGAAGSRELPGMGIRNGDMLATHFPVTALSRRTISDLWLIDSAAAERSDTDGQWLGQNRLPVWSFAEAAADPWCEHTSLNPFCLYFRLHYPGIPCLLIQVIICSIIHGLRVPSRVCLKPLSGLLGPCVTGFVSPSCSGPCRPP